MSRSTWACELKSDILADSWEYGSSRSTWACELKSSKSHTPNGFSAVTLHVSVWVEIFWTHFFHPFQSGHAPRERVSWNALVQTQGYLKFCHAPRERVSWNKTYSVFNHCKKASRSTWACELKFPVCPLLSEYSSHAPRERVSWNPIFSFLVIRNSVTLHVSVWVEIHVV